MERWQNKVAIVTGSSSGIGASCCKYLLEKGMIVVGLARRLERMETEFKPSLPADHQARFHPLRCDVTVEDDIVKSFAWVEEKFGGVAVLVNNAGIARTTQLIADNNTADLKAVIDTNIMGFALCTREAFRSMKAHNVDGHVIVINSIAGHKVPYIPGISMNIYPATKFAVTAMTESLRRELFDNGTKIKITSLSPGAVDTEILGDRSRFPIDAFPMLNADDIADAVVYCLQTPPHVQVHELTIKPVGEMF